MRQVSCVRCHVTSDIFSGSLVCPNHRDPHMPTNLRTKVMRPVRSWVYLRALRGLPLPKKGEAGYAAQKLIEIDWSLSYRHW